VAPATAQFRPDRRQRLFEAAVDPVERKIDHRRRIERQHLAQQQPPMMENASGNRNVGPVPAFNRQRSAQQGCQRRIMMGRKRNRQACPIASVADMPGAARLPARSRSS